MSSLSLKEFGLSHAICEIRYPDAYKFWDSAGEIWANCDKKWSSLELQKASPNTTSFKLDKTVELTAEINRVHIKQNFPKPSLEDFIQYTSDFLGIVFPIIEVKELSRIGFRIYYSKEFDNKETLYDFANGIEELGFQPKKCFGIEPKYIFSAPTIRYESDTLGVRANINYVKKELNIDVPPDIKDIESVHNEYQQLVIDYDYYTLKPAKLSQINISDWIKSAFHVLRRDHESFWKGII